MTVIFSPDGDPAVTIASLRLLADDLERMSMFEPRAELDDAPLLEKWCVQRRPVIALAGLVSGHPLLGNRPVMTSELFAIDRKERWARTFSRFYRLGTAAFPTMETAR
jgi:hypothetical protein